MKVIFFGRKNDHYSKKILNYLKKNYRNVDYFMCKKIGEKFPKDKNKSYDILYSFRNYIIFKKNFLKKIKKIKINFHPGPPKYRGTFSVSMALKNNDKTYACTAHVINEKIDNGKILDIQKFNISKKDNLKTLLNKAHKNSYKQCIKLIKKIYLNSNSIRKVFPKIKTKWSRKYYSINYKN